MTDFNATRLTMTGRAVFVGFCIVAAVFLFYEHTAHVLGALPYLLLLACPLMHLVMHHGHHGGHDHARHETRERRPGPETAQIPADRSDGHA